VELHHLLTSNPGKKPGPANHSGATENRLLENALLKEPSQFPLERRGGQRLKKKKKTGDEKQGPLAVGGVRDICYHGSQHKITPDRLVGGGRAELR